MTQAPPQKENFLVNILINIIIPTLILSKLSGENDLGVTGAILVALAFPICYGLRDLKNNGKFNLFSAIGIASVALTGGMALLELPPRYIVIKEATVPAVLAMITLISMRTRYPLVKVILYNDKVMKVEKVAAALRKNNSEHDFERALNNASYLIAIAFIVSSILNYILATMILVSPPGTEAFNAELGQMNALSFPVIALPVTAVMMYALFYLFKRIKKLTQLEIEDILIHK